MSCVNTIIRQLSSDFGLAETVVAVLAVYGGAVGALLSGLLADRIGPKRAQIVAAVMFLLGALLAGSAAPGPSHAGLFAAGRVIAGLGEHMCGVALLLHTHQHLPESGNSVSARHVARM